MLQSMRNLELISFVNNCSSLSTTRKNNYNA